MRAASIAWSLALTLAAGAAHASTLDQSNAPSGGAGLNDSLEWQQGVTAGLSGSLAGIELFSTGGSDTVSVSIGLGGAGLGGSLLYTSTATLSSSGTFIDLSAAHLTLTSGEHFFIDVQGGPGCCGLAGTYGTTYPGGDLYLTSFGNTDYSAYGYDMAFQTFVNAAPVPEPAEWSLALAGLSVMGLMLRRGRGRDASA